MPSDWKLNSEWKEMVLKTMDTLGVNPVMIGEEAIDKMADDLFAIAGWHFEFSQSSDEWCEKMLAEKAKANGELI